MKLLYKYFFLLVFTISLSLQANQPSKAENFTLKDYNGREISLIDFADSKAIVVMFIATKCPVSNAYNQRMSELNKTYSGEGITFLGINSNKAEDAEEVKKHAEENGLDFIIVKDPGNKVADAFEASVTPEVYVLNKELEVLYHGRIDDSRRVDDVTQRDLADALDSILAGRDLVVEKTKAFGCSIKRVN